MRKTDISNFNEENVSGSSVTVGEAIGAFFSTVRKIIVTMLMILLITGLVIGISLTFYVISVANEPFEINLNNLRLNLTSFVYVPKEDSDDEFKEYLELYSTENRVWVSYKDIPKSMIDAQIAIEDKRFEEHNGVDWYVDSIMNFDNGCAEMEVAFDRSAPRNAEIYGSEGSITIVDVHRPSTWIVHKNDQDETFTAPYINDDFYGQIHHFDELIRQGKEESDVMTYDAILREAHILECIRGQYACYDENDLRVLEKQEEELAVSSFSSEDALKLGNTIAELAKEYDRPVAIRIDRCEDSLTLFQYMMDGKTVANLKYMDGKKQSVLDSGHSSAWVYVKLMADDELAEWKNDGIHLISGGAFPLYMDGRIVAVVQVSGLHEGKDHELIVRGVSAAFGKEFTPFRKALG